MILEEKPTSSGSMKIIARFAKLSEYAAVMKREKNEAGFFPLVKCQNI